MNGHRVWGPYLLIFSAILTPVFAESGIWLDVPFVRQEEKGCGSASISMLMQYWAGKGHPVPASSFDPMRIQELLYSEKANGIYASDLEKYLKDHDFLTFVFRGNYKDLEHHLSKGRPMLVSLDHGPLHYVVVVGLIPQENVILVNDPARRKRIKMDREDFERSWAAIDHWSLLAVPKNASQ